MKNIQKYIDFVKSHEKQIVEFVDQQFDDHKEELQEKILKIITGYIIKLPDHFEWSYDGCPYDFSGEINKDGKISLDQTILDFLENEYTGEKTATYTSGYGFYYERYGDKLSYKTLEIGCNCMKKAIRDYIESSFNEKLTDEEFETIGDGFANFDSIYMYSITNDFFEYEGTIEYLEIGDKKLSELKTITDTSKNQRNR